MLFIYNENISPPFSVVFNNVLCIAQRLPVHVSGSRRGRGMTQPTTLPPYEKPTLIITNNVGNKVLLGVQTGMLEIRLVESPSRK